MMMRGAVMPTVLAVVVAVRERGGRGVHEDGRVRRHVEGCAREWLEAPLLALTNLDVRGIRRQDLKYPACERESLCDTVSHTQCRSLFIILYYLIVISSSSSLLILSLPLFLFLIPFLFL